MGRPVRRLPSPEPEPVPGQDEEAKLELVPEAGALDTPEEAAEEPEDEEEKEERQAVATTQDPLKLYVRQIGDGPC